MAPSVLQMLNPSNKLQLATSSAFQLRSWFGRSLVWSLARFGHWNLMDGLRIRKFVQDYLFFTASVSFWFFHSNIPFVAWRLFLFCLMIWRLKRGFVPFLGLLLCLRWLLTFSPLVSCFLVLVLSFSPLNLSNVYAEDSRGGEVTLLCTVRVRSVRGLLSWLVSLRSMSLRRLRS